MSVRYLVDTSAWNRMPYPQVEEVLGPLIMHGEVGRCSIIDLEVLYSARSPSDYRRMDSLRRAACRLLPIDQGVCDRAQEVQAMMADASQHRVAHAPDLLIAACAEANEAIVLHYDSDFDHIAKLTGQPVEWVVPRGSVP